MSRLPVPGSDDSTWGDILNDYLIQSHTSAGLLKPGIVGETELATNAVTSTKIASGAVTKGMVGLANVDNTSDANKPVSTAQQTALDLKTTRSLNLSDLSSISTARTNLGLGSLALLSAVGIANITATGTASATTYLRGDGTWATPTNTTYTEITTAEIDAGTATTLRSISGRRSQYIIDKVTTAYNAALTLKAPINSPTFTGTVSGVTKTAVGLGNVDNTSDANKPVSTAAQTELDLKAPINSPTFTGTVAGVTKTMVGLANVDNTSDANKPVSTATQTALNLKANTADLGGKVLLIDNAAALPAGTPANTIVILKA